MDAFWLRCKGPLTQSHFLHRSIGCGCSAENRAGAMARCNCMHAAASHVDTVMESYAFKLPSAKRSPQLAPHSIIGFTSESRFPCLCPMLIVRGYRGSRMLRGGCARVMRGDSGVGAGTTERRQARPAKLHCTGRAGRSGPRLSVCARPRALAQDRLAPWRRDQPLDKPHMLACSDRATWISARRASVHSNGPPVLPAFPQRLPFVCAAGGVCVCGASSAGGVDRPSLRGRLAFHSAHFACASLRTSIDAMQTTPAHDAARSPAPSPHAQQQHSHPSEQQTTAHTWSGTTPTEREDAAARRWARTAAVCCSACRCLTCACLLHALSVRCAVFASAALRLLSEQEQGG